MKRAGLLVILSLGLALGHLGTARAGGSGFGDEDEHDDEGSSFFGFVRDVRGASVSDAKVVAELKDRGALVTRTDIMGVYKIPGFGKEINPDDVKITCAKEGYKQMRVQRRPRPEGDATGPIEIECYLQRN